MNRRALLGAAAVLLAVPATSGRAQRTLRVGSTPTGVPFTFLDTKTNTIQGIMVDLIEAVGREAGFGVRIEPLQFSTLIPALTSNKIDLIAAAMYATPARAQVIDFSTTVITYGEGLVVPVADKRDYASYTDLKGYTVGAQVGTAYVEPLQKSGLFADVKIYDTIPDILRDVNAGRIQAGLADYPIVAYNVAQGSFPGIRLVRAYEPSFPGSVAVGLRKSDPGLLAEVNTALAKLDADGTTKRIIAKWGL